MRLNVGVIFGGKSVEHEVSIISALQMMENMNRLLYNPIPIYLSKDNDYYNSENMYDIEYFKDLKEAIKDAKKIIFIKNDQKVELIEIQKKKIRKLEEIDMVFLVVHGQGCEDGTLAAYFDVLNVPYVGSSLLPSSLAQNKWKFKQLLEKNNISTTPYIGFYEDDFFLAEDKVLDDCEGIGYPLIVKPAHLGSSVGIKKVNDRESLHEAILEAIQYDTEVVVEKALEHIMELNCSVYGDNAIQQASVVERVLQTDEILSYQDKYLRGKAKSSKGIVSTSRELPAKISEDLTTEIQLTSKQVFKLIGASRVSIIDFLYETKENKLYVNEINTIPGSLSYYLWKNSGIEYKEFISKLIENGLIRYRINNT